MCKVVLSKIRIKENRIIFHVMTAINSLYVRKICEDKLNMWVFLCVQKRNGDYKLDKKKSTAINTEENCQRCPLHHLLQLCTCKCHLDCLSLQQFQKGLNIQPVSILMFYLLNILITFAANKWQRKKKICL